jgi:dipeptidyl aminopeptidase/acylaminoacyl peptidase
MLVKEVKPYGYWNSPVTTELITQGTKRFSNIVIDGDKVYWDELHPSEKGRSVIVSEEKVMTPPGISVRTRANEYGGKSFTVVNGVIYFVSDKDQRIYVQKGDEISPLTEVGPRFADLCMSAQGLIAIAEFPSDWNFKASPEEKSDKEISAQKTQELYQGYDENRLVLIDLKSGELFTLASGCDFYSSPALSPDGKKIAWLSWDLPLMPWDGTDLWVAEFKEKKLQNARKVAGGKEESIFEPSWSSDGHLYYISDKSGWWNLYCLRSETHAEPLYPMQAEFGLPQWVFGMSTYGFIGNNILCTYFQDGKSKLALFDTKLKKLEPFSLSGTHFTQIRCGKDFAVFLQASQTESTTIVRLDLKTGREKVIASNTKPAIDAGYFSIAQPVSYQSAKGRIAYGFYYPPKNRDYQEMRDELPPLIVRAHGGPTSNVIGSFDLKTQFWTSRGFAILDVNYGGSTGYGRAYRDLLKDNWGIVDVEDCVYGANFLVEKGLADPKRLAITGGSAGGYTTLAALAFTKTFSVGASYFGVSDLEALTKESPKFESRYLEDLIGPYPARRDLYKERSPLYSAAKISCPVIFFQGREDKIVPLDQAEVMYDALKKQGIFTKLIIYDGEQHGFRKAENIKNSMEEELKFYLEAFKAAKKSS